MRLSGKIVRERTQSNYPFLASDFSRNEFYGAIENKGYSVCYERAYICGCKTKGIAFQSNCKNCGASGWFYANPIKTKMIIHSISSQRKYEQWGQDDLGMVQITAFEEDKLSQMDRITILEATTEHKEVLYPTLTDDETTLFAYTHYNIKSIDFIGLFINETTKIQRLLEPTDYSFHDNVITFGSQYTGLLNAQVTIRYVHAPVYHVMDIARDSMRSTITTGANNTQTIVLPVHAIGKRSHLVPDAENLAGNRLLDNSWLPITCEEPEVTSFNRQLKYTDVSDIYDNLTDAQKVELELLLSDDSDALGVNGGIMAIEP